MSHAVQFVPKRSGRAVQFGPRKPDEIAMGILPACRPAVCARMKDVSLQCWPLSSHPIRLRVCTSISCNPPASCHSQSRLTEPQLSNGIRFTL